MNELTPFSERLKEKANKGGVDSLDVLAQRLPFFSRGVAALTGMRCHRENLECWSRWDQESGRLNSIRPLHFWLALGCNDLKNENDPELFGRLLLEPMYWLEESVYERKEHNYVSN